MSGILSTIESPADLRKLSIAQLKELAEEIRQRIIAVVGRNGGHLASNLGVVEITIALHYVFDFLHDRLLWDVGHQAYVHKLLTGRNKNFDQLRKAGGPSGFPNIDESPYDLFNVGHAGTAIPTAVGMARAASIQNSDASVVALVGDASIVNGVAFEGLNQGGLLRRQLLVILNDNSMGIAPTQGGFAEHLAKFRVSPMYEDVKKTVKRFLPSVPVIGKPALGALDHLKEGIKAAVSPHQIFEQIGYKYVGPTDGHDIEHLIELLRVLKSTQHPVLLHVHTTKGRGAEYAVAEPCRFHSPNPFRVEGCRVEIQSSGRSWTAAFADALIEAAKNDPRVFGLTAAMPDGTGLNKFQKAFPDRYLDGGIAESSTVDIAAGMCKSGLRPVCAIYSTFLQRAFDQVFQEVVLQGLPVIFCLDRAGFVGSDGAVHHGYLDISYLRCYQHMVLMAPADEPELNACLRLALKLDKPCAIRYPRDNVPTPFLAPGETATPEFELGRSRILRKGGDATIVAYGVMCREALDAAELLANEGPEIGVVNARFAKPIDRDMVAAALETGHPLITVEDHTLAGGFGSALLETAQELGLDTRQIVRLGMPAERFTPHGARSAQLAECGLDAAGIAESVQSAIRRTREAAGLREGVGARSTSPRAKDVARA